MAADNKDDDVLLDDHNYDGIQEYDNPMPRWWVNLFWATILFSVGYCIYYMTGWGPGMLAEYDEELKIHEARQLQSQPSQEVQVVSIADRLLETAKNPQAIEQGKTLFATRCLACHGDRAQGLIGPNLTDESWIHGGSLEEIFMVVTKGVPTKGMIPWEGQLTEAERMSVVAYIRSIQNTNVPGKPAEGVAADPTPL